MADLKTPRFAIPLLASGQAHKELFHNEALSRVDFLMHPIVQSIETDPANVVPVAGQAWLVGSGGVNAWLDHDDEIAGWTGSGWLFFAPPTSMRVYIESEDIFAIYRGSWQMHASIGSPAAGAVIDVEARSAIDSILDALLTHGIVQSGL